MVQTQTFSQINQPNQPATAPVSASLQLATSLATTATNVATSHTFSFGFALALYPSEVFPEPKLSVSRRRQLRREKLGQEFCL